MRGEHGRLIGALCLAVSLGFGCSSSSGSSGDDENGGFGSTAGQFDQDGNPIGSTGSVSGDTGSMNASGSTSGSGTGGTASTGGTGGTGASNGGSNGVEMPTGPLGNVGQACSDATMCPNGICASMIPTYGPQPGGACSKTCMADADCGARGLCTSVGFGSSCVLKCSTDGDCRSDYFCSNTNGDPLASGQKICRPKPFGRSDINDGKAGQACADDTACGTNAECKKTLERRTPTPNGYCSGGCFEDADCGTGGLCIGEARTGPGIIGQCYQGCKDKNTCPSGYECRAPFTADGSLLGLVSETACLPPPPPTALTGNTAGKACTDDDGCPGGACEQNVGGRQSPGNNSMCTGTCTQPSQCGTNADCYGYNALAGTQGECIRKCNAIADCDNNIAQVCVALVFGGQKYCVPRLALEPQQM